MEGEKNFPGKPMVGTFSTPHELSEKPKLKIKTRDLSEKRPHFLFYVYMNLTVLTTKSLLQI